MGVDGQLLLKMLEPAIRPGGVGGASRQPERPIESQSFEELLSQRMSADPSQVGSEADEDSAFDKASGAGGPLGQLARVDQIENASLRALIAGRHADQSGMAGDMGV